MIELARRAASDRNLPSRLTLDLDIGNSRRLASSLSLRASLSRTHAKGLKDAFRLVSQALPRVTKFVIRAHTGSRTPNWHSAMLLFDRALFISVMDLA